MSYTQTTKQTEQPSKCTALQNSNGYEHWAEVRSEKWDVLPPFIYFLKEERREVRGPLVFVVCFVTSLPFFSVCNLRYLVRFTLRFYSLDHGRGIGCQEHSLDHSLCRSGHIWSRDRCGQKRWSSNSHRIIAARQWRCSLLAKPKKLVPGVSIDSELKLYRVPQRQRIFPAIFHLHPKVLYSHLTRAALHIAIPSIYFLSLEHEHEAKKKKISTEHDGEVKKKRTQFAQHICTRDAWRLSTGVTISGDRFDQSCPYWFRVSSIFFFFPLCDDWTSITPRISRIGERTMEKTPATDDPLPSSPLWKPALLWQESFSASPSV